MRQLGAAGLVMILAGLGAYYATERELTWFSQLNLAAGAALLLAGAVAALRELRDLRGARARRVAWRWSLLACASVVGALAIGTLSYGWDTSIDLTIERTYTLSPQTLGACEELPREGEAAQVELLFFEDAKLSREIGPLVRAYGNACPRLGTRFLMEAEMPPHARAVLGRSESTVVACQGERCEYVGFPSEENLTHALLRLLRRGELFAYFLLGHGEADLADETDHGFHGVAAVLRAEGIEPRGWIGPASASVPDAANLLIVPAPQRDLLDGELAALDGWLTRGGRMLALLQPGVSSSFETLLARWGFETPPGILADRLSSPLVERPGPQNLLVNSFDPTHKLVRGLDRRTMLLVPGARAVIAARKPEPDDEMRNLVYTSAGAWLERDVSGALAGRAIRADADEPSGSEIPLAAAGRYPRGDAEARIVVIGSRDFASNQRLQSLYNRDLLMNAIWWLAEDDRRIAIRPKLWTPDFHPLTIQETLAYFQFFGFALPEILLLLGIAAWYRQRPA